MSGKYWENKFTEKLLQCFPDIGCPYNGNWKGQQGR